MTEEDINKVCKWLEKNLYQEYDSYDHSYNPPKVTTRFYENRFHPKQEFIERFRKEMEK